MDKINIGTNPDGSPRFHFSNVANTAIIVGPIKGTVTLDDGTVVDVSDDVVEATSLEQANQIAHHVGLRYAAEGHPHHQSGDPFIYEPPQQNPVIPSV